MKMSVRVIIDSEHCRLVDGVLTVVTMLAIVRSAMVVQAGDSCAFRA